MSPVPRLGVALAAGLLLAGCSHSGPLQSAPSPVAAQTDSLPAPARLDPVPAPGTVTVVPGPFSDRFTLTGLRLAGNALFVRLKVTSDVSELIDLEVSAAFYDAAGRLIGVRRTVYNEGDGGTGRPKAENGGAPLVVRLDGPPAASARLSVPVLVNE